MEYLNVEAYERGAGTCLDGATCEGGTWARAPCVAGTRETEAPCAGTGGQCSVESGHAYSWFVVVLAVHRPEVPASSVVLELQVLGADLDVRETSRGYLESFPASSAVPDPRVPGADLGGLETFHVHG